MSSDSHDGHFIIPIKYYLGTFATLLVLTVFTVVVSRFDLGVLNTPIAIGVAVVKASCVALFFMGLKWDRGISSILFVGAFICVLIFFLFTFADIAYRDAVLPQGKEPFGIKSPVKIIHSGDTTHHGGH